MPTENLTVENMTVLGLHLIQEIKQALPIEDLMAWLIDKYPQADLKQIMAMLNVIYQENFEIVPASEEKKTYQVGDRQLFANPQKVIGEKAAH